MTASYFFSLTNHFQWTCAKSLSWAHTYDQIIIKTSENAATLKSIVWRRFEPLSLQTWHNNWVFKAPYSYVFCFYQWIMLNARCKQRLPDTGESATLSYQTLPIPLQRSYSPCLPMTNSFFALVVCGVTETSSSPFKVSGVFFSSAETAARVTGCADIVPLVMSIMKFFLTFHPSAGLLSLDLIITSCPAVFLKRKLM